MWEGSEGRGATVTSAAALASALVPGVSTPDTSHGPNTLSSTRPDFAADADAATALAAAGSSTVTFTSTLTLPADALRSTAVGDTPSLAATSPLLAEWGSEKNRVKYLHSIL